MKEIFVYVEGPSDQLGMRGLLANLIELSATKGNKLDFYSMNGKEALLNEAPRRKRTGYQSGKDLILLGGDT